MKLVKGFARFWYDFIVGDDWRLAIYVVVMVGAITLLAQNDFNWWWFLPLVVGALLAVSVTREMRRVQSPK